MKTACKSKLHENQIWLGNIYQTKSLMLLWPASFIVSVNFFLYGLSRPRCWFKIKLKVKLKPNENYLKIKYDSKQGSSM